MYCKITDKRGNELKMFVSTPSAGTKAWHGITQDFFGPAPTNGTWKALDKGFLRFNVGRTRSRFSHNGDMTTRDLLVLGIETHDAAYDKFGMQLFEHEDAIGVNDNGEGIVIQPWVISLTPGRISWRVVS